MTQITLHTGWHFKAIPPSSDQAPISWQPATVPGTVQQDLLRLGQIPDPYYGLHEHEVQWVGNQTWLYQTHFTVTPQQLNAEHLMLECAGLDTFCTVHLNGTLLLESDNMFLSHHIDVKKHLLAGENTLDLCFKPALQAGLELQQQHGPRHVWNGNPSRVQVRKAQYHYGWDWGPTLLTSGPWKPILLHLFQARIQDVHVPVEVTPDLKTAFVPVQVDLEGRPEGHTLQVILLDPQGNVLHQQEQATTLSNRLHLEVQTPQLWYPNGLGAQPLYTLEVRLLKEGQVQDTRTQRLGMRRLRVLQERVLGEEGTGFTFEVNNQPFFAGGANWIPEHLLLNTVTDQQYRERLTQARDANMTMIRVWGGGIYEADMFYDLCDELGLMVWQDFMFGCGMYPAHPEFLSSVRLEAEQQVKRLRNHASLALWCGNNEDYLIAQSVGAYGPGGDESKFEAQHIYEVLLREVCERLDPGTLYWPGSPYGGTDANSKTVGDRHTWEIWHVGMAPYQEYKNYEGRFVSEFGMMSAPSMRLIQQSMPEHEQFPESETFVHHTKATGPNGKPDGARRLAVYQADNLRGHQNLEEYVYNTQFVQAEAMRYAYRDFRKRFEGPGKYAVSGALVWQLNDCWPVSSWAIIDSAGIAKPAYYTIKRELAPLTVGLDQGEVWLCSSLTQTRRGTLKLYAYTLTGTLVATDIREVEARPGRKTLLDPWTPAGQNQVLFAEFLTNDTVVARASQWPEPFKHLTLPDAQLRVTFIGENLLQVTAQRPIKGLWFETGHRTVWQDNFVDLRPFETRTFEVQGLKGQPIKVHHLRASPIEVQVPEMTLQ